MADYFEEMGWQPLADGEAPDSLLHFARLLRDFGMFDVLGEDKKLPPPAAKEAVKSLEEKKCSDADEKCTICLKEYTAGEIVKILPCKHDFHPACILPWLEKTNSCPVCRHELPTDDENYEQYRKEKIRAKQREAEIENLHNSMFS